MGRRVGVSLRVSLAGTGTGRHIYNAKEAPSDRDLHSEFFCPAFFRARRYGDSLGVRLLKGKGGLR